MPDAPFRREDVIDRDDELRRFTKLLTSGGRPRLLAIEDGGGTGKSHLMRLLRYEALGRGARVCLVECDGTQGRFELTAAIAATLQDAHDVRFDGFMEADALRRGRERPPPDPKQNVTFIVNQPHVEPGGYLGGIQNFATATDERAHELWRRTLDCFVNELAAACDEAPVVLLLDNFDGGTADMREWLFGVLRRRVFERSVTGFCELVLVLAGRHVHLDDLRAMLGERFDRDADVLAPLSVWEPDHVRTWLRLRGKDHDDTDVQWYYKNVAVRGYTILQLETTLAYLEERQ